MRLIAAAVDIIEPDATGGLRFAADAALRAGGPPWSCSGSTSATAETEFVLVLDDVHTLDSSEALAVISAVAEHLPPGSQLALGARSEPALPIGHLRTHRMLTELRSRDLAMTTAEAQRLLAAMGLELEPGHVATLLDRTEGWPAGLYLAVLSLQEQPDVGAAVARFAGDDRLITDYLRDELLSRLSPQHLRFLMRTSVLDRVCGPLCDAVLERSRSGAALRDMSRSNLLLIPLDRHDKWYRYHTLVLETLRGELHRREPELEAELHRRASAWYAEQDEPDRAIEHALAAGDAARAGELMWAQCPAVPPQRSGVDDAALARPRARREDRGARPARAHRRRHRTAPGRGRRCRALDVGRGAGAGAVRTHATIRPPAGGRRNDARFARTRGHCTHARGRRAGRRPALTTIARGSP